MAVLNLTTLRSELGQKIKRTNLDNSRLDRWLNLAVDDVLQTVDSDHLIESTTFSTVSGQRVYYLGDVEFNKVLSVVDTTNQLIINYRSEYDMEETNPTLSAAGTEFFYNTSSYTEYEGQPLTASATKIVSNSASDTTQSVRITGIVNSVQDSEKITLNGTTTVTGTKLFSSIHGVRKDGTTVGRVRVNSNDASTTKIADISPTALIRQYQPIFFAYTPNSVSSIRVRYIRKPWPLINTEDVPDVSSDQFHELVLIGGAIRGHRDLFDFKTAELVLQQEWMPMVLRFKKQQGNKRGRKSPVIGGDRAYFELGRLQPRFGTLD